jgi:predicted RNase H-like HicB family nuclease
MASPVHLTILFDEAEDGWIVASVPEVPGAHSQGRTQDEARENVLDALNGLLELRAAGYERTGSPLGSESLELTISA